MHPVSMLSYELSWLLKSIVIIDISKVVVLCCILLYFIEDVNMSRALWSHTRLRHCFCMCVCDKQQTLFSICSRTGVL